MRKRTDIAHWIQALGGIAKFAASSLIAFTVDYGMFSLLVFLTKGLGGISIPISNVVARAVSASMNFWINKRFVFRNTDKGLLPGAKYFALAASILGGNTTVLYALVNYLNIDKYAAKLMTETLFFIISWYVQKVFVFRTRGHNRRMTDSSAGRN